MDAIVIVSVLTLLAWGVTVWLALWGRHRSGSTEEMVHLFQER
ncbi:MAG: hypothetical protein ACREJU_19495 [Nitrospiraceae bacterium]